MTDWDDDVFGQADEQESIIELTEIVTDDGPDGSKTEDIIELTDIVPSDNVPNKEAPTLESLPVDVSTEQIEAALERVIEKKIETRIEAILFEVMEKVIEKELSAIRVSLQKDLDQIGTM